MFLGDARNNYHATNAGYQRDGQESSICLWLNPEPKSYWDTGDSVITEYGTHTDGVWNAGIFASLRVL